VQDPEFMVSWSGSDETDGSGVANYDVYVSVDDGPFTPWLRQTTDTAKMYLGEQGRKYSFYSVARDNVGHVELPPATADAATSIEYTDYPWYNHEEPLDVNDDAYISPIDALLVINELNRNGSYKLSVDRPRPLTQPFYDVNPDGYISPIDALLVINRLNRDGDGGEGEMSVLNDRTQLMLVAPEMMDYSHTAGFHRPTDDRGTPETGYIQSPEHTPLLSPELGEVPDTGRFRTDDADEFDDECLPEDLQSELFQFLADVAGDWTVDEDLYDLLSIGRHE
jgi:hypothetical protein